MVGRQLLAESGRLQPHYPFFFTQGFAHRIDRPKQLVGGPSEHKKSRFLSGTGFTVYPN